jgi:hypothetical protein
LEEPSWFLQAAIWEVSGDDDPADGTDRTFQSYENEDALAILQSNDYGWDIDTNYRGFIVTGGILGWSIADAGRLDVSVDFGGARFVHRVRNDAGARFTPHGLGYEIDLDAKWQYAPEFSIFATAAVLVDSAVLDQLTSNRETFLIVFGGSFKF